MQFPLTFLLSAVLAALVALSTAACGDEPIDYNREIRPILSDRCFFCHGPDKDHREADLRLDHEESAKEWVIVAGDADASELISRITSEEGDLRMPPPDSGKALSQEEIELIRRWIEQGAGYADYWAYVPPRRHPVPGVSDETWPANWIDNFILHRLEQEDLRPAPDADRVTLLRRLTFDLTGLPPTPDDVAAFLEEDSPDGYERVVDRLLDSDRYGERMAMYWLDLVRYADTVGYHGDQEHHISPYRVYVIDAFNDNLPFDRFTREQLAGDLLPEATVDQRIATGYNRLLQTSHEGGVQPKEYLAIYAADRVRNLSAVWMGGTVGCAECHDHKYDPYTAKDFYSIQAFFADVDEAGHFKVGGNSLPTNRPPEIEVLSRRERGRIGQLEEQIRELEAAGDRGTGAEDEEEGEDVDPSARIDALRRRIEQIRTGARKTMITVSIEPRTIRVLPRGDWLDESGPVVEPAVPEFLGELNVGGRRATRLDLANWLTDPDVGVGGLTARVMVNRFWYLLFGVGLSNSLEDFGGQGEPPVHPELLDHLAVEFHESGWDVKHLMKLIVMSRAYRQSSVSSEELRRRDPENRLYARQSRFRLPAETIRDNALSIGGLLVLDYGGASVRPYQPEGYYRHLNFPKRRYEQDGDERQWRRGVYVHWQRQFLHPMLKAFDAPSREECTAERPRSNTPLAALALLNDPSFVEAARGFAVRILDEGGEEDASRVDFAFRLAVSRSPDEFERNVLVQLLNENRDAYRANPAAAEQLLGVGQSAVGRDRDMVEVAAWMQVARAILNLNETTTKN